MGSSGGLMGGIGEVVNRGQQRQGERNQRREYTRALEGFNKELEAYQGRSAPFGNIFTEQGQTAGARLADTQRAGQNVLQYLQGSAFGGEPTGVGSEVLSRQREAMGRGLQETNRATQGNLAAAGMGRSGPGQAMMAANTRGFNQASALAETQQRQKSLQDLTGFVQGQQAMQGNLAAGGLQGLRGMSGTTLDFLNSAMGARQGRAGVYQGMTERAYGREQAASQSLSDIGAGFGKKLGLK